MYKGLQCLRICHVRHSMNNKHGRDIYKWNTEQGMLPMTHIYRGHHHKEKYIGRVICLSTNSAHTLIYSSHAGATRSPLDIKTHTHKSQGRLGVYYSTHSQDIVPLSVHTTETAGGGGVTSLNTAAPPLNRTTVYSPSKIGQRSLCITILSSHLNIG